LADFENYQNGTRSSRLSGKKAMKMPIMMLFNEKYRPDVKRFVCTCLQFVVSCFLICKHLIQLFQPVDPIFFLQVTRNRSTPFWSHPALQSLPDAENKTDADDIASAISDDNHRVMEEPYIRLNTAGTLYEEVDFESDDEGPVNTWEGEFNNQQKTCREELTAIIHLLQDFVDGLEYQVQFQDLCFLKTLEKEGAGLFRLAHNCLSCERHLNSSRAASPTTWESSTANTHFYWSYPQHNRDQPDAQNSMCRLFTRISNFCSRPHSQP
jgi:hypothetical protein